MRRDERGEFVVGEEAGHLSLGFFRDTMSGEPCLMVGLNAFKRRPDMAHRLQ
jgi:hypothetical protein